MSTNPSIIVVCHDAGGAEIISAYVRAMKDSADFFCYTAGPAEKIFSRKGVSHSAQSIDRWKLPDIIAKNARADALLAGVSWASAIELEAIRAAKSAGIKTIAYLDHWAHYKERFGFPHASWGERVPDELWTGDEYAYALAKRAFPGTPVELVANRYFEDIRLEYRQKADDTLVKKDTILFLSEPLSGRINAFGDKQALKRTEYDLLGDVLSCLAKRKDPPPVVIRLHPSEQKEKYAGIMAQYARSLSIRVSDHASIYDDLLAAVLVIGMESMALAIAYLCGSKAVSYLPPGHDCPLPFPEIIKIHDLQALEAILSDFLSDFDKKAIF